MSEMENPHHYRKVGYSMILVAASLTIIGLIHMTIGENVLYGDQMQRDKTAFFEECKAIFYATEECQKFDQPGNTLYAIDRLPVDMVSEEGLTTESTITESVTQTMSETVIIPDGVGMPGCEETSECYLPSSLTVVTGATVIWDNVDTAAHLATSGTPAGGPDGVFDSGIIAPGNTFEHEFTDGGEFQYYCLVHPWMVGTVTVE
jgi:plastocyanin